MGVDMYSEATEDVFFDDLRKRILLLTADDEDGFAPTTPHSPTTSFSLESGYMECWEHAKTETLLMKKGNVFGIPPLMTVEPDKRNIWSWELQPNMLNIWSWEVPQNECKGTGVFIPRLSRRKSKAGKTQARMKCQALEGVIKTQLLVGTRKNSTFQVLRDS